MWCTWCMRYEWPAAVTRIYKQRMRQFTDNTKDRQFTDNAKDNSLMTR